MLSPLINKSEITNISKSKRLLMFTIKIWEVLPRITVCLKIILAYIKLTSLQNDTFLNLLEKVEHTAILIK